MNLAELVARHATGRPDAIAVEDAGGEYTYRRLDRALAYVAHCLGQRGVVPGMLVAVGMRPSGTHLAVLLALARLGAVSMPITPGEAQGARDAVARRFGPAFLVSRRKEHGVAGVPFLRVESEWFQVPESFRPAPPAPGGNAPWRVNLTSGTTGAAKGTAWSHAASLALLEHCQKFAPFPPGSRLLCNRGMDTAFMLRFCMSSLFSGGTIVFRGTPTLKDFVDVVRRYKVSHAVVEPVFLQRLVAAVRTREPCLPELALFVGGGIMSAVLLEAAIARLTPNVYDNHGASETGLTALGDPQLRRTRPDVTGRLVPWVEAQAVDESDRPLPEGERGILRYRSPVFATEYYQDPQASAQRFRGGWFYPGDIGSVAGGLLALHSRADEVINLGGLKVNPVSVEAVLAQHPSVSEAAVFATNPAHGPAQLAAAIVMRGKATEQELIEFCRARLGRQAPSAIIRVAKLPRNAAGKLLRRELPSLGSRVE